MAAADVVVARSDGRLFGDLRDISIVRNYSRFAEGSALVSFGDTRVLCTATVEEKVPQFLRGSGKGWVTAEYSMLPRATAVRTPRESTRGKISGRSHEIQRLIGRSLRSGTALDLLGERTVWIDCDVLQADGGTRTAAVTGGFVALLDSLRGLFKMGTLGCIPITGFIGALSVGKIDGKLMADLCYEEDSRAEVDCNIVMNEFGDFIEIQGTAEGAPFTRKEFASMLDLAEQGISSIIRLQKESLDLGEKELEAIDAARDRLRQQQQK